MKKTDSSSFKFKRNARNLMHHAGCLFLFCCGLTALSACQSETEETSYPPIITDFANLHTDPTGNIYQIEPDDCPRYYLDPIIQGNIPNATLRALCGYALQETDTTAQRQTARLYTLTTVELLQDSTQNTNPGNDPTKILSAWKSGRYINLHLAPLTQGGRQYWGYRLTRPENGRSTYTLTLYHNQNNDPQSFTQEIYASISLMPLMEQAQTGDTVRLQVNTYEGVKTWAFTL